MARGSFAFPVAQDRAVVLGEIHARPSALLACPRVIFQLAFLMVDGPEAHIASLAELSRACGVAPPEAGARHHTVPFATGTLRWERHTEFSTWFWDGPVPESFGDAVNLHPFGDRFVPPGPMISGMRVEIRGSDFDEESAVFDEVSTCASRVRRGQATIRTDFRQDGDGLTRFLLIDNGLSQAGRGSVVQRLCDIETYRTLAMLGLPLAQSLSPQIARIESEFASLAERMRRTAHEDADALLSEVTVLASEVEAHAAASLYRFGASRAYYDIVQERLQSLGEVPTSDHETIGTFLEKRMAPAMRTCRSVEERQANLSRKLTRATSLIRSWIDVELERQNAGLLASMNRRATQQLRLQQTVEGLSVAAISYYVIGLIGYLAKALQHQLYETDPAIITGACVPVVVLVVWWGLKRMRKAHAVD
ncbi:Egg lysin [Xaviernesmea oryzae]|uniref:Egg lysin n=1 Tax=Xaviernesmea oryzae TaxID=464029 RepID=A0A1Q9AZS4_9HYPH|nr:DUF3422 family protein [Xaviernesmea oryzae]OLP61238.1 Egg lysin [Xaviernesmea oryzae]SEL51507.1 Uncharacterized membrane-anchored protein [Xaviernesmea oryzae]